MRTHTNVSKSWYFPLICLPLLNLYHPSFIIIVILTGSCGSAGVSAHNGQRERIIEGEVSHNYGIMAFIASITP